jgi:hypothetical protein
MEVMRVRVDRASGVQMASRGRKCSSLRGQEGLVEVESKPVNWMDSRHGVFV